ncbi:MAG: hypothetical protein K8T20_12030 [Planctomycetes bacterium]|nr:hypothetical protein [Planctomycetota bacterium]
MNHDQLRQFGLVPFKRSSLRLRPRFELGSIVATLGALCRATQKGIHIEVLLSLHERGFWHNRDREDTARNNRALKSGLGMLMSTHGTGDTTLWIITEWDRSCTTVLRPEDY